MAAVVEESQTGSQASGSSVAVTFGTAPQADELIVLVVEVSNNNSAILPAGFNRVVLEPDEGGIVLECFVRLRQAGDGTTYTVNLSGTSGATLHGFRISGLSTDRPWDVGASTIAGTNTNSLGTGTTPTTQDADTFLLVAVAVRNNSPGTVSWTNATALEQSSTGGSGQGVGSLATGSRSVTSTGTFSDTASWSSNGRAAAFIMAFRESEAPPTDAYRAAVLADTPSHYWRMGESTTLHALNECLLNDAPGGTGLDASGDPTFGTGSLLPESSDTCVTFDGSNDEFNSEADGLGTYIGEGSIEFWVKANASRDAADTLLAIGGTNAGLIAWQWDASGNYQLHWRDDSNNGRSAQLWNPTTGDVDHVVIVSDATSMRIYRNGVLHTTITTNAQTEQNHTEMIMGRNKGGTAWWTGEADEVAVYEFALTLTRIEAHYDAATTAGGGVSGTAGQATETSTAQAVSASKVKAVGQAVTTAVAQAVSAAKALLVGQATTTETAQPVSHTKTVTIGQAIDTSVAQAVSSAAAKAQAIGQAAEADTSQPLTSAKAQAIGQAAEADTAQPTAATKIRTVGQATEADTAQAVTETGVTIVQIGQATESDLAQTAASVKTRQITQAVDSAFAQALTPRRVHPVGQATSVETAQAIAALKQQIIGQAVESDSALGVTVVGGLEVEHPIGVVTAPLRDRGFGTVRLRSGGITF